MNKGTFSLNKTYFSVHTYIKTADHPDYPHTTAVRAGIPAQKTSFLTYPPLFMTGKLSLS